MNFKKTAVTAFSIPVLALSICSVASAKEPSQPIQLNNQSIFFQYIGNSIVDSPFKAMKRSVTIDVGETYPFDDNAAWGKVIEGTQYAIEEGHGVKGLKDSGKKQAIARMWKSNGDILGDIYITVKK